MAGTRAEMALEGSKTLESVYYLYIEPPSRATECNGADKPRMLLATLGL